MKKGPYKVGWYTASCFSFCSAFLLAGEWAGGGIYIYIYICLYLYISLFGCVYIVIYTYAKSQCSIVRDSIGKIRMLDCRWYEEGEVDACTWNLFGCVVFACMGVRGGGGWFWWWWHCPLIPCLMAAFGSQIMMFWRKKLCFRRKLMEELWIFFVFDMIKHPKLDTSLS